jgi:hypothetical protein
VRLGTGAHVFCRGKNRTACRRPRTGRRRWKHSNSRSSRWNGCGSPSS